MEISKKGSNFIAYFYVEEVDSLYNKVKDKVEVIMKPKDQPYGIREFTVKDPFEFVLTFAQVKK